jgi:hypothetical protein
MKKSKKIPLRLSYVYIENTNAKFSLSLYLPLTVKVIQAFVGLSTQNFEIKKIRVTKKNENEFIRKGLLFFSFCLVFFSLSLCLSRFVCIIIEIFKINNATQLEKQYKNSISDYA